MITLQHQNFNKLFTNYQSFANRFSNDLNLAIEVGNQLQGNSQDRYANNITELLMLSHRILPFISELIDKEIEHTLSKETLMRSNTLCTKVITYYLKLILKPFVKKILSPLITKINNTNESYEIDRNKLSNATDEEVARNLDHLKKITIEVVDALIKNVKRFPKESNTICHILWKRLEEMYSDDEMIAPQLVGGILFLRVFCAFIATPDANQLLPPGMKLTSASRRRFILVSKTIQAISNSSKNSYDPVLVQLTETLKEQVPRVHELLRTVSQDLPIIELNDFIHKV